MSDWNEYIKKITKNIKKSSGSSYFKNFKQKYEPKSIKELEQWIETFVTDKTGKKIHPMNKQLTMVWDIFSGNVSSAILWKTRGTGGTLFAGILAWLIMVFRLKSVTDMAGSFEQGKNLYKYVLGIWNSNKEFYDLLLKEPTQSKTILKYTSIGEELYEQWQSELGVNLEVMASSDTKARGGHNPMFIGDEACQKEKNKEENMQNAIQGVFANQMEAIIFILSTYHLPTGLFADLWTYALEKGFKRYKWNIYDAMKKCDWKGKCEDCPLSRYEIKEIGGKVVKYKRGCWGIARRSDGWYDRKSVIHMFQSQINLYKWSVEHEGVKPIGGRHIFTNYEDFVIWKFIAPKLVKGVKFYSVDWGKGATAMLFGWLLESLTLTSPEQLVE